MLAGKQVDGWFKLTGQDGVADERGIGAERGTSPNRGGEAFQAAAAHRGRRFAHSDGSGRARGCRAPRADPFVGPGKLRRAQPDDAVSSHPQARRSRADSPARRRRRPPRAVVWRRPQRGAACSSESAPNATTRCPSGSRSSVLSTARPYLWHSRYWRSWPSDLPGPSPVPEWEQPMSRVSADRPSHLLGVVGPQLQALLLRPVRLADRDLDANGGPVVARVHAHPLRPHRGGVLPVGHDADIFQLGEGEGMVVKLEVDGGTLIRY